MLVQGLDVFLDRSLRQYLAGLSMSSSHDGELLFQLFLLVGVGVPIVHKTMNMALPSVVCPSQNGVDEFVIGFAHQQLGEIIELGN